MHMHALVYIHACDTVWCRVQMTVPGCYDFNLWSSCKSTVGIACVTNLPNSQLHALQTTSDDQHIADSLLDKPH